ncbi:hypothetical protein BGX34_005441 [Mortierella sp. NVP85]|nr:hypothetical protein BGX34_005441 [Mortierella sp. NVP85]
MGAQWKREKVQDHKFDFINVEDFIDNSCWRQFQYMLVFATIIRGILVYCSDIFTAVNLLTNTNKDSFVSEGSTVGIADIKLPYSAYKYLFTGCIIFGFLLLGLEIRRASGIIKSRDISHAFTSQIASRFYSVRSYPHYCFFAQINNSKKTVDEVAFFCFFTFRSWKRLMLADAPRQTINATILYQVFSAKPANEWINWDTVVGRGDKFIMKKIALCAMLFTVAMFALSLIKLIAAVILYIPLVSHIRGNLKEFCCHKIDKRIDELIKKNTKDRAKTAMNAKGGEGGIHKQPTLPQLDMLEAPPTRNMYNQPLSRNGSTGYGQQQGYPPSYKTPSPHTQGYNYSSEDYFHSKPPMSQQREADPYAESAFNSEDVYDGYNGAQDTQHLQQQYGSQRAPSRPGYQHQRTGSHSQHGSDLDSNHGAYNNGGYGGQGYGNDYYPSGHGVQMAPQRPQRQGTMPSRDQSFRNGGGYQ